MERHYYTQYSEHLQREMHVLVYGYTGVPIIVFPCQDSMCDNFENFGMIDVLQDYIDGGKIQIFSVDTSGCLFHDQVQDLAWFIDNFDNVLACGDVGNLRQCHGFGYGCFFIII